MRIDSIYNPVRRANFAVAETRVGQRTDYDRLVLTVETNGTVSPEEAVSYAAALAQTHFQYFANFGSHSPAMIAAGGEQTGDGAIEVRRRVHGPSLVFNLERVKIGPGRRSQGSAERRPLTGDVPPR